MRRYPRGPELRRGGSERSAAAARRGRLSLLVDNALSPRVAQELALEGYDVVHVRDRKLQHAEDEAILACAEAEGQVVVSADTDFGSLLASRGSRSPSFVLWRAAERQPLEQTQRLALVLREHHDALVAGAILAIDVVAAQRRTGGLTLCEK